MDNGNGYWNYRFNLRYFWRSKAVAISDTINGYGLFRRISNSTYGIGEHWPGQLLDGLIKVFENSPEKFNVIGAKGSVMPFEVLFTGLIINQIYFWSMNQTIIQRALGAKILLRLKKDSYLLAF